ncbi:MAG: hypothetical protein ABIJ05_02140 [Patescibacteria group bacterium]
MDTLETNSRTCKPPKAGVITDEYKSYTQLPGFGYRHNWVNHKKNI